jgi:hypothetical protein
MSDCKVFRTEIDETARGDALGRAAAVHAEACAACGSHLRERERLRGLVRGLGRVEAPPDFEFRLRARMAASKPGGGGGLFARLFPVGGLAWAAVAVCVLSVSAAVYFVQSRPPKQGAPNVGEVARAADTATQANNAEPKGAGVKAGENAAQAATAGGPTVAVNTTAVSNATVNNVNVSAATQKGSAPKRAASQPRVREFVDRGPQVDSTRGGSIVADLHSARVLPLLNSGARNASRVPTQGIELGTSAGTLRVVLRDERGTLVPMRSVSFGSQEPLSRDAKARRAPSKDEEGVW